MVLPQGVDAITAPPPALAKAGGGSRIAQPRYRRCPRPSIRSDARMNRKRNARPADKIRPKPVGLSWKPRQAHASRIQKGAKSLNCNGLARDMSDPHPMRSTNMLEHLNEEIKRRTKVVRILPDARSCLRLVRALCAETRESWMEDGVCCPDMNLLQEQRRASPRKLAA